jgi:hypothetical protein
MRNLVVHGAAVLGMGVADERAAPDGAVARFFEDRLEPARRAVDEQFFADWCCRHRVRLLPVPPAKVTPDPQQANRNLRRKPPRCWLVTSLLL